MYKKFKKTLMIDLDGVLNQYTGNYNKDFIPPIREGAKDFLISLQDKYEVKIFTTRDEKLVQNWIKENGVSNLVIGTTSTKEPAWLYIDDRAITFNGDYKETFSQIENFQAWFKK